MSLLLFINQFKHSLLPPCVYFMLGDTRTPQEATSLGKTKPDTDTPMGSGLGQSGRQGQRCQTGNQDSSSVLR